MDDGRIAVLGAGTMGRGIAQLAAQAGYETLLQDPDARARERALPAIAESLATAVSKGKMAQALADAGRLAGAEANIKEALTLSRSGNAPPTVETGAAAGTVAGGTLVAAVPVPVADGVDETVTDGEDAAPEGAAPGEPPEPRPPSR